MKLVLINGQCGTGKTSISRNLLAELKNSAYVEADSLVTTNPWEFGGKTDDLAISNAVVLISNFLEAGFENIIVSGLTRNQELLDKFLEKLNHPAEVLFVWIRASEDIRKLRKMGRSRDNADQEKYFNVTNKVYPDIHSIKLKSGQTIFIDSSTKTIEETTLEIMHNL